MDFDFGTIAKRYDDFYRNPVGRMIDRMEKRAVGRLLLDASKGGRLVEVGCGTGHWSEYFVSRGYEVVGIDRSPEMIEVARSKNLPGASFHLGDGKSLEFPDGSFDAGAAITVVEFVSNPKRIVGELARVVKPFGRIILGVLHEDSYLGRKRKRDGDPVYSTAHFFQVDELRKLLSPFGSVSIIQCLFAPPIPEFLELADEIEQKGIDNGWKHGNFLVASIINGEA